MRICTVWLIFFKRSYSMSHTVCYAKILLLSDEQGEGEINGEQLAEVDNNEHSTEEPSNIENNVPKTDAEVLESNEQASEEVTDTVQSAYHEEDTIVTAVSHEEDTTATAMDHGEDTTTTSVNHKEDAIEDTSYESGPMKEAGSQSDGIKTIDNTEAGEQINN